MGVPFLQTGIWKDPIISAFEWDLLEEVICVQAHLKEPSNEAVVWERACESCWEVAHVYVDFMDVRSVKK